MPEVTVLSSPKGLPIATTHSPTSSWSESPKFGAGKARLGVDLDNRDVGFWVPADDFGFVFLIVGKLDDDLGCILDHMIVGQNRPVTIDDKAGAQAALALWAARLRTTEKAPPKIVERIFFAAAERAAKLLRRTAPFAHLSGGYIDDERLYFFRQIHEIRQTGG